MAVNCELLKIYWEIGSTILEQQKEEGWGAKIVDRLAADLKAEFPDFQGLSVRNLKYMRAFAEAYPDFVIVQTPSAQLQSSQIHNRTIVQHPAAQITWSHNQLILDKVKTKDERIFYAVKAFKNGWSLTN